MIKKKKSEKKSWGIAVYFALVVFLIITTSLVFKIIDVIRSSRFDGSNSFVVASINNNRVDLISVSPKEGKLTELSLSGTSSLKRITDLGIPVDGYIQENVGFNSSAKSFFIKNLFKLGGIKTNLTIIDLIRLSLYSVGVGSDKQFSKTIDVGDGSLDSFISTLFIDPQIAKENTSITITNSTNILGLGNKIAKDIVDMGGNVVLVNSSQNDGKKSVIYYKTENYTVKKLSKFLQIPTERKNVSAFSDIIIVVGEDRGNFPNL